MHLTVTELNYQIKHFLENNQALKDVTLEGEISNWKFSHGHYFFAIKDETSLIKCIIYASTASRITEIINIKDGAKVVITSSINVYPKRGEYSLIVTQISLLGLGALHQKYLDTKKYLAKKGIFDQKYKKVIPQFPRNIGIVTSPTGAAVEDIVRNCQRRWPIAKLTLFPVVVQGPKAASSIANSIKQINDDFLTEIDVLIIGRGGGSFEDLFAFNELNVLKAIFYSKIPIIAAIGHENDESLAEFVADAKASTPTGAAEIATPNINALIDSMDIYHNRLVSAISNKFNIVQNQFNHLSTIFSKNQTIANFEKSFNDKLVKFNNLLVTKFDHINSKTDVKTMQLKNAIKNLWINKHHNFTLFSEKLDLLNPQLTIAKGYAAIEIKGKVIKSINEIKINDKIKLRLIDGSAIATINQLTKTKE